MERGPVRGLREVTSAPAWGLSRHRARLLGSLARLRSPWVKGAKTPAKRCVSGARPCPLPSAPGYPYNSSPCWHIR